jgi:HEAT repeat protein
VIPPPIRCLRTAAPPCLEAEGKLVTSAHSDLLLQLTLVLGLAALAVSALLVLQLVWMRLQGVRRERTRQSVNALWRPLLAQAAQGAPDQLALPPVVPSDLDELLLLWNQRQDGAHGSAHAALNRLAQRLDLLAQARRLLRRRRPADRLLGVATLGHLGQADDAPLLGALLGDPNTLLSMGAARAMLRIDAAGAVPSVLERYLRRSDWPAARLGALLRDAGADAVAPVLEAQLYAGSTEARIRLLPLLRHAHIPQVGEVLRALLARSTDPQLLSDALRQLHDRVALPRVRELGGHPDALVRSAAAVALGRIGGDADRAQIVAMMADADWWVRYRAAQALLVLPGHSPERLDALRATLVDRFARDALDHVRAERAIRAGVLPALPPELNEPEGAMA